MDAKVFGVSVLFCAIVMLADSQNVKKEIYMTVPQLISSAGYPVEKHRAKTPDGYILQLHRIPAGRRTARRSGSPNAKGKKAVLIVHGLLGSSSDFVIMGPERSLGFILADAGYDVWLGNLRGNVHTSHQTLKRNNPEFWAYSFHEHGKYDAPAMIDKVLNMTGLEKVFYIGYSMGTTTFFTMMAQRPEYNDKVIAFVALAPAVYLDNMRFLANFLLKTVNLSSTMRARGMLSLAFEPGTLDFVVSSFCATRNPDADMCMRLVFSIVGEDYEQNDWDMMPVILSRFQPASWGQLEHFGKIAITGVFTSWEDGLWGAVKPYNLSNVAVPVSLFYGENDQLTEKSQVLRLAAELNSTGVLESLQPGCSCPKFNHLDFVFAKDVGNLINKPLVKHINMLIKKYDKD
ncbi:lipase 3-like isoform X2 [Plodia interpunctella]|uniref:lipase 3-like isoform X2 n=1 Tax=Plodia interpunctella TaxID=58824 RepID=UPI00236797D0|nr:lipase 3-like isoform X2 [Plodia interpunctella]XP_053616517.1 lipase 3-like isoform X2 [Plodia interpunctella]